MHFADILRSAVQKRVNLVDRVKSFQTRSSLSMYVIATVFCSIFHFSVSLHVPFSQFLFERDSYQKWIPNEYLLAKFGVDTAENGPLKVCQQLAKS